MFCINVVFIFLELKLLISYFNFGVLAPYFNDNHDNLDFNFKLNLI
jgi:hypothetical protein